MAEGVTPTNGAHGREERTLAVDQPPSSSTKSVGKAIPTPGGDNMTHVDMDDSLKSTPVPKKNQPPKIPSYLNDTRDHSPSRDEGRELNPQASKYGLDDNTQTGESLKTRSIGVVRDGITSPRAAELAKGTAAASSSMKSVVPVDPKTEESVNSLAGPSSSTPSLTKAVQDAPGGEEHKLAVGRPPIIRRKSLGKAIETSDEEHDGTASSTKIIPKPNADVGPGPSHHDDGVVAAIGGLAPQVNASNNVASSAAPTIRGFAQHDANGAMGAMGAIGAIGGGGVGGAGAGAGGPVPAQINGGGIVVIAARPAPAAIPVAVLPPNPRVNGIDPLTTSGIRPRRSPADGDEGKIWEKLS